MYPFEYIVIICSEYNDFEEEECKGITFARNFTEAMKNIENFYGKDLSQVKDLICLEEGSVYEFDYMFKDENSCLFRLNGTIEKR